MRRKVTLVARNMERAEKIRLQKELKDAVGSVGVAEIGPIYSDDQAPAEMAEHASRSIKSIISRGRGSPYSSQAW